MYTYVQCMCNAFVQLRTNCPFTVSVASYLAEQQFNDDKDKIKIIINYFSAVVFVQGTQQLYKEYV